MEVDKREIFLQKAKEDLRDLKSYIEEFLLFLPSPVCAINPLGILTDANKAFYKLTGYKERETINGKIIILRIVALFENRKKWKELEKRILNRELIKRKEMILIAKNKKRIPISLSASFRENEKGQLIGYFLAFSDITETKALRENLEQKVEERTKELQERVEELEKFHKLTVGRELKMMELKKEIKEMKKELEKVEEHELFGK